MGRIYHYVSNIIVFPFNYRSRNRQWNLWGNKCVPPDDLWIGLDIYTNCILIYDLLLKSDWWGVSLVLFALNDGKEMAHGGLPFLALDVL